MAPAFAFLESDTPLAFAHRGGAAGGIENSLAAFDRAVRLGYRYLETDVHVTADGALLAFHDATLDRVTDHSGRVSRMRYAEIRPARIGGVEPIPLLEDLLGAWPDVRVNVDVKVPGAIDALVEVIRRTGTLDRVCVAAFSESRVARARAALGPRLCTALGPRGALALRLASYTGGRGAAGLGRVPCAQVPARVGRVSVVDERFVRTAHRLGVQVHVWTVDDPVEMHRLLDLGVDGIMTDEVEALRDVLASRRQWPTGG